MPTPISLAGPHGSGKTVLGERACQALGLRFLDLSPPGGLPRDEQHALLEAALATNTSDVIALSHEVQQEARTFKLARRAGVLVGLWAHPLEMQARSDRSEPLFTPSRTLTTKGGFGREGTRCPEFRRLNRACEDMLLLRGLSLDEATQELTEALREIREDEARVADASPIEREGLSGWMRTWREEYLAKPKAAQVLGDALARYFLDLKANGTSPRTLSGIESDLEAAAILAFSYAGPKGEDVLECFEAAPCEYEFRRKFTDTPNAAARYRRSVEGFASFLERTRTATRSSDE